MTTTPESRLIIAANDVLAEAQTVELTSTLMQVRIGLGSSPESGEYIDLERTGNGDYQVCGHTAGVDTIDTDDLLRRRFKPRPYDMAVARVVEILTKRIARARLMDVVDRVVDPKPAPETTYQVDADGECEVFDQDDALPYAETGDGD